MEGIALPLFQLPLATSPSSFSSSYRIPTLPIFSKQHHFPLSLHCPHRFRHSTRSLVVVLVGSNEETTTQEDEQLEYEEPNPQDLEYVRQIKRLKLLGPEVDWEGEGQ
ncbi:ycf3-interacting protein 1, chloroplastic-like [Fagus crenata]